MQENQTSKLEKTLILESISGSKSWKKRFEMYGVGLFGILLGVSCIAAGSFLHFHPWDHILNSVLYSIILFGLLLTGFGLYVLFWMKSPAWQRWILTEFGVEYASDTKPATYFAWAEIEQVKWELENIVLFSGEYSITFQKMDFCDEDWLRLTLGLTIILEQYFDDGRNFPDNQEEDVPDSLFSHSAELVEMVNNLFEVSIIPWFLILLIVPLVVSHEMLGMVGLIYFPIWVCLFGLELVNRQCQEEFYLYKRVNPFYRKKEHIDDLDH